jgi:hypothetical protein
VKKVGIDHVGISSDFNDGGGLEGWKDVSEIRNVTAELLTRGYSETDIANSGRATSCAPGNRYRNPHNPSPPAEQGPTLHDQPSQFPQASRRPRRQPALLAHAQAPAGSAGRWPAPTNGATCASCSRSTRRPCTSPTS